MATSAQVPYTQSRVGCLVSVLAIALSSACAPEQEPSSNIRVRAAALTYVGEIDRVTVSVMPGGHGTDLVRDPSDGWFYGNVLVPTGNYVVQVNAFGGVPAELVGTGSASATVLEAQTASVLVRIIDVRGAPPVPDHSPIIVAVTAVNDSVIVGQPAALSVDAVDVDGDTISYAWSQTCEGTNGSFSAPSSATTAWTPEGVAACTLRIEVTANGKTDAATLDVRALNASGGESGIAMTAQFVPRPYISEIDISGGGSFSIIYRESGDATVPFDVAPNMTLRISIDLGNGPAGNISLSDDCGGTTVEWLSSSSPASFDWTAPASQGVCVISAKASSGGLMDTFPIALLVKGSEDAGLASVTVTNLSGDLANTASWTASYGATLTRLTVEQFSAEQPSASLPAGHVAANGVLKISVTAPNGGWVQGRNLPVDRAFASLSNITPRFYLPPSMEARWAAITTDQRIRSEFVADEFPAKANAYCAWMTVGADTALTGLFQNVFVPAAAGVDGTLGHTLSNIDAVVGSPAAGRLRWFHNIFRGDPAASAANPLVIYLLDIVEIVESKPTIYFRWDDGSKDHRAVSSHMRNGTKFGGGALARPLPSTFAIIQRFVGGSASVSRQDLRDMASEGSEIVVHGYGANGGTWGAPGTDADMATEIETMQALIAAEGWPRSWRYSVVFPGNDLATRTADGTRPDRLALALGMKLGLGTSKFGFGFSFRAMTEPMSSLACIALPSTADDARTVIHFMEKSRLSLVLMGHVIGAGGSLSEADFDEVMGVFADELASKTSRIRTADLIGDAVRAGVLLN